MLHFTLSFTSHLTKYILLAPLNYNNAGKEMFDYYTRIIDEYWGITIRDFTGIKESLYP